MALYRSVRTDFWEDAKVAEDFSPEDRYFYLYLFTNPHTRLCGCYEVSKKQVSWETGYASETIDKLLNRFSEIHKVIKFNSETKEILLLNWHKYNWTSSDKIKKPLIKEITLVKCDEFREYLSNVFFQKYNISIPYGYGMETPIAIANANTNAITNTDAKEQTKLKKLEDYYLKGGKNG